MDCYVGRFDLEKSQSRYYVRAMRSYLYSVGYLLPTVVMLVRIVGSSVYMPAAESGVNGWVVGGWPVGVKSHDSRLHI
jgi:hypothetical protein